MPGWVSFSEKFRVFSDFFKIFQVRYVLLDLMPIVLFLHPPPDPPGEDEEILLINKEEVPSFAPGSELEHIYNVS